jgi:aryl sulfotransferase
VDPPRLAQPALLHYRDLRLDLEGEMRRLARFLEIAVAPGIWPALVEAARFAQMKRLRRRHRAGRPPRRLGQQRRLLRPRQAGRLARALSEVNQALYQELAPKRAEPALRAWLEGGRGAVGDPRRL